MIKIALLIVLFFMSGYTKAENYRLFEIHEANSVIDGLQQQKERELKDFGNNGKFKRSYFKQELEIGAGGTVYHPNLMVYQTTLGLNLDQGRFSSAEDDSSDNPFQKSFFGNYSLSGILLPKKKADLRFSFVRNNRRVSRSIYESIKQNYRNIRIGSQIKLPAMPVNISGGRSSSVDQLSEGVRKRDERDLNMSTKFTWNKTFEGEAEFTSRSYTRIDNNTESRQQQQLYRIKLQYPSGRTQTPLKSTIDMKYNDREGLVSSRIFDLRQSNQYRISDDLHAAGSLNMQRAIFPGSGSSTSMNNLNLNLKHELYLSLISEAGLQYSYRKSSKSLNKQTRIPLKLKYKKNVPGGRLFLNYSLQPMFDKVESEGGIQIHSEHEISFADGDHIINSGDIDTESLILRSPDGLNVYQQDLDYQLAMQDGLLVIRRIPGSDLPENEFVILEFFYRGGKTGNLRNVQNNLALSYHLNSFYDLRIGYRSSWNKVKQDEKLDLILQDERAMTEIWAELKINPVNVKYVNERSESRFNSYLSHSGSGAIIFGSYISQYLRFAGSVSRYIYDQTGLSQDNYIAAAEYFRRFSTAMNGKITYNLRKNSGEISNSEESRLIYGIEYKLPKFQFELSYEKVSRIIKEQKDKDWELIGKIELALF